MNRIRVMSDNPDHVSVGDYDVRGGDHVSVGYHVGCGDQNNGGDFVCVEVEWSQSWSRAEKCKQFS